MDIPKEILDTILKNYQKPEDLMGQGGIIQQLTKQLIAGLKHKNVKNRIKSLVY